MRRLAFAFLLASALPALCAEYMEKTPFQISRAFSPGVITDGGKIVWVAGQTATRDKDDKDIAGNFEAQVHQVFYQIDAIMKRAGGSLARSPSSSRSRAMATASWRCARSISRTAIIPAAPSLRYRTLPDPASRSRFSPWA